MAKAPKTHRLFDLPLGTRFKYAHGTCKDQVFVFLGHGDRGLVGDYLPLETILSNRGKSRLDQKRQGLYSAGQSREHFERLRVVVVE